MPCLISLQRHNSIRALFGNVNAERERSIPLMQPNQYIEERQQQNYQYAEGKVKYARLLLHGKIQIIE